MNFESLHVSRDELENPSPLEKLESHIVKWPFMIADLILVITAFTIAFANGGPLTTPEFACCVLGVGLGGAIAITPFLIDSLTNSRLRMMRKLMEQREQWRINLEQELIDNQEDNRRKIRLLKESVAALQAHIGVSPVDYDAPPQPEPQQTSLPLVQDCSEPETVKVTDMTKQEALPAISSNNTDFTTVRNKLLSKAITQAQKNNPSKTVNRLIKGLDPQEEKSA